jgi:hypothetical protein
MRESRSFEKPASSGFARGNGSWAKAVVEANRQSAAANFSILVIQRLPLFFCSGIGGHAPHPNPPYLSRRSSSAK